MPCTDQPPAASEVPGEHVDKPQADGDTDAGQDSDGGADDEAAGIVYGEIDTGEMLDQIQKP